MRYIKTALTKRVILLGIIVATAVFLILVYVAWLKGWIPVRQAGISPTPEALPLPSPAAEVSLPASLGGQIFEKAQNPIQGEVPQTNPFREIKTNPFEGIYKNPFE